jgi:hypothetical protein
VVASLAALIATGAAASSAVATEVVSKQVVTFEVAQCLIVQAPNQSLALMRAPFNTPDEVKAAKMLLFGHNSCVKTASITSNTGAFRGAVAEALLHRDKGMLAQLAAQAPAVPVRAKAGNGLRPFLVSYATCLVDADGAHTAALLRTERAGAEERGAFLAYGDALMACMPEKMEYAVNVGDMRNQIAAVAYRHAAILMK